MPRESTARYARLLALSRPLAGPSAAILFVVLATTTRLWLGGLIPGLTVFSLYYPAILGAALIGGELSAALALGLSVAVSWIILHNTRDLLAPLSTVALNVTIFVLTASFIGATGSRLRWLLKRRRRDLERLGEREARYRALFEGVAEAFALTEGFWSEDGRLLDFRLLEGNPALLKMFRLTPEVIGQRHSEHPTQLEPEYVAACERAFAGPPVHFELYNRSFRRWYDVRISRVGDTKLAQIFVDITERKVAESRQTEMFDELNHRVKNNLAAVAAILGLQARVAEDPRVADQLRKAVDRIETIADVHASLYRVSSTDEVDFAAYLQRLCERLATGLVDRERVRIELEADPAMAPLEEAVALGLVVNQLVTNAAKYAYPAPAAGVIRIELRNQPGQLVLKVADQGKGLSENGAARGIGMRLVRSLVQQCGGELEVGTDGPGACFTVRLRGHGRASTQTIQSQLL